MRCPERRIAWVSLLFFALLQQGWGSAGADDHTEKELVVNGLVISGDGQEEVLTEELAPRGEKAARKWIVRFAGPIMAQDKARAEELGCVLHDYLPDFGFVATMDDRSRVEVARLPFVREVVRFRPDHKLPAELREKTRKSAHRGGGEKVSIQLKLDSPGSLHRMLSAVAQAEAEVLDVGRDTLRITVDEAMLPTLAAREEVVWINEYRPMGLLNDSANWVVQSNASGETRIWDKGIRGQGQVVAIGDTGLDYDMPWFRDQTGTTIGVQHRKIVGYDTTYGDDYDADAPGHGTHVSGTLAGDRGPVDGGTSGNGLAPGSRLFVQDLTPGSTGYVYPPDDLGMLFLTTFNAGARLHSDSWGNSDRSYGPFAASADRFLWEHKEFLALFANGNSGSAAGTVGNPATAKNVVSVGASYNGSSAENVASFSSNGPAADGRIKPTVTAPGYAIVSADSDGLKESFNSGTISMNGTSMATPAVAGAAALIRQYLTAGYYPGGALNPAQGFAPSAALIRGVLINCAQEMGGAYTGGPIPATGQGWGRVNLANTLAFTGDSHKLELFDETVGLATGESWQRELFVEGGQPLKATLVWTDYPGATGAARALVNDLDLTVTAPDGTIYLGNYFIGGASVSGGNPDRVNVEEQVLLKGPAAGLYTFSISGYNTPFGPQPFALVITGGSKGSSKGVIALNKRFYSSHGTLELTLADLDLNADPAVAETATVTVSSGSEPGGEMVVLTESGAGSGVFVGTLQLAAGGASADGRLQVVNGDAIIAAYLDGDDGSGRGGTVTAAAMVDDVAPNLSVPQVTAITDTGATVAWTTDEPADTLLTYGPTPDKGGTVADGRLAMAHLVNLSGLKEATVYYAGANSTDEAGNSTSGPDVTFTTGSLPPSLTAVSSEGAETTRSSTVISGVSRDPSGVTSVTINGIDATYRSSDGYYNLSVPLKMGSNVFTVTALDSLGNAANVTLTVTRLAAPDLTMMAVVGPVSIMSGATVAVMSSVQASSSGGNATGFFVHLFLSADSSCSNGDSFLGSRYVPGLSSGATSTATLQVEVPLTLSLGGYHFCAIADPYDNVAESDESNNALVADAVTYVGADLAMTGVSGPASIKGGSVVQVTNSVLALPGGGAASGFYVYLYLSADASCSAGDTPIGSRYVSGLASGGTSTALTQVAVPRDLPPGSYYYCGIADQYNYVQEGNEGNNALAGNAVTYTGADLVMTEVSGPASIKGGSVIQVTNSVQALPDGGAASGFYIHLYLSADTSCSSSDTPIGSRYVSGLASGGGSTALTQVTVPGLPPGSYYYCGIADQYNYVREGNEGNNGLAGNVATYVGADLVMTEVSGPASIKGGSVVQVTNSVLALPAGGAASGFYVHLYLSADASCSAGDTPIGSRYVSGLASGGTSTALTQVAVPRDLPPGTYYYCGIADQYNYVREGNEGNNGLAGNIATYVGADLVMTEVGGPASIKGGSVVQVTNSVLALPGGGAASGFYVHLYLSADASCSAGDTPIGSRHVPGLASGGASTALTQVAVPRDLPPGTYYYCGIADQYNYVREADESNNTLLGNMTTYAR